MGHRYYDSDTGRFLTRDPIKDGRNWYSYCENNPVSGLDPDGLRFTLVLRILIALVDIFAEFSGLGAAAGKSADSIKSKAKPTTVSAPAVEPPPLPVKPRTPPFDPNSRTFRIAQQEVQASNDYAKARAASRGVGASKVGGIFIFVGLAVAAAEIAQAQTSIDGMVHDWYEDDLVDGIPTSWGGLRQPNPNSNNPRSQSLGGDLW